MAFGENQVDGYDDGEKPIGYHHKTGEYRESEPQFAKDLASGKSAPKHGFFKVLVSTRGNRSMFVVLCISFVLVILVSLFGKNPNEGSVNNVYCNLKAFAFDDKVYVTLELKQPDAQLKKRDKDKPVKVEPHQVNAHFDLYNTDKAIADQREGSCLYDGTGQFVRETFNNYDITQVKCTVTCGDKSAILTAKVEQR